MLATVLPGLRDLRAPLAAGYLWLVTAWIVAWPWRDDLEESDVGTAVEGLAEWVTAAGAVVAVGAVAYLVGAVSVFAIDALWRRAIATRFFREAILLGSRTTPHFVYYGVTHSWLDFLQPLADRTRIINAVWLEVRSTHDAQYQEKKWAKDRGEADRSGGGSPEWGGLTSLTAPRELHDGEELFVRRSLGTTLAQKLAEEEEQIADSLLDEESDLYGPIDRLRGEVEFRIAIIAPLLALGFVVYVVDFTIWGFVGFVVAALLGTALLADAGRKDWDRRARIVAAVSAKPTRSPTIKRLERALLPPASAA